MPAVQRNGDANSGGGVINTITNHKVKANGELVSVNGSKGTGHGIGIHAANAWDTAKGSSTGAAQLESLPFTIGNNDGSTSAEGGGFFTYWLNMATDKLDWTLRGSHNATTANISVSRSGGHTQIDNATDADFTSTTSIRFVMTYQA